MAVHIPVAAERSEELLAPAITTHSASGAGAVLLDGTLGLGGHTERFLEHFPELTVIGLDRDEHALALAGERLARFGSRAKLVHTRYDNVADALAEAGLAETDSIDAALYDLGVSSMQLDEADRGFAYAATAPLDMRMDRTEPLTAADVLNTYSKAELTRILATYGEERFAAKIAGAVVREREDAPFATSDQLVELLYRVIPAPARRTGGHPAKRTFQALRVEVNQELESLRNAVPAVLGALRVGGRAVFLSYQSLEDRIVKTALAAEAASRTPQDLPVELPGLGPRFRLLTRGAEKASAAEIERNPRAASVRIRGAERIDR